MLFGFGAFLHFIHLPIQTCVEVNIIYMCLIGTHTYMLFNPISTFIVLFIPIFIIYFRCVQLFFHIFC